MYTKVEWMQTCFPSLPLPLSPAQYPSTIMTTDHPISIDGIYDEVVQVPTHLEAIIPCPTTTIISLIAYKGLPPLLNNTMVGLPPVASCIGDNPVAWTEDGLLQLPVPPRHWLGELGVELNRRLHKSPPVSLQHPTIPNLYFPLWVVNFWSALRNAAEQRNRWIAAQAWVRDQEEQGAEIGKVNELLQRAPWGMEIWAPVPSTSSIGVFAILLSTGWLRERHIDAFASYLAFKARGHVDGLWIGGLHLSVLLKAFPEKPKWAEGVGKGLAPFEKMFTEGGYKNLLFPANINDSHWILFSVDIEERVFCFGMSVTPSGHAYTPTYHLSTWSRGLITWW